MLGRLRSWLHMPEGAHAADCLPAEHPALACPWQSNRIWQDGSLAWLLSDALSARSPSPSHVFPSIQEVRPILLDPKLCCLSSYYAALTSLSWALKGAGLSGLQHESESADLCAADHGIETQVTSTRLCSCMPNAVGGQSPAAGASRGAIVV